MRNYYERNSSVTPNEFIIMTLDKIIYDIRERLKITTDDMDMTDEYFAQLIHNKRSVLVKQRYGKVSKNIPDQLKQTVSLDLEFNRDK